VLNKIKFKQMNLFYLKRSQQNCLTFMWSCMHIHTYMYIHWQIGKLRLSEKLDYLSERVEVGPQGWTLPLGLKTPLFLNSRKFLPQWVNEGRGQSSPWGQVHPGAKFALRGKLMTMRFITCSDWIWANVDHKEEGPLFRWPP
jgi:hypothetical protein